MGSRMKYSLAGNPNVGLRPESSHQPRARTVFDEAESRRVTVVQVSIKRVVQMSMPPSYSSDQRGDEDLVQPIFFIGCQSNNMTINALPEATIRLLGSAQALTTPTSLVKELIDNALDAKATAIDILISTNTIDRIEVRDNGHGIPREDLDALGRHGHTSKLRSFDELRTIGGLSLGFRGEALASAVQLGEVSVTTRTEGETAATTVKLKPVGGVASQTRTSNPIGTTIIITNFLSKLPVRKQKALKEAPKMLSKLRDLLQAYCLARPHVRFSLKVMKSPKGSWLYAPRPNDGIREAVSLVIGRDTASQCMEKSLFFPESGYNDDISMDEASLKNGFQQFVIEMFLPKPDADLSKIGYGQYISIDSRPVSHEKGTMRKIVTLFRSYLKESLLDSSEKLKNPFLWMNIRCPVASYDANVEPAKDDVLFSNESLMLEAIEKGFEDVYGNRKEPSIAAPTPRPASRIRNFDTLKAPAPISQADITELAEATPASVTSSEPAFERLPTPPRPKIAEPREEPEPEPADALEVDKEPIGTQKRKRNVDMSEDCREEIEGLYKRKYWTRLPDTLAASSLDSQPGRGNGLNPWLIAKMTSPLQREREDLPGPVAGSSNRQEPSHKSLPTSQQLSDPLSADLDIVQPSMTLPRPRQIFHAEDITSLSLPAVQHISRPHHAARQPSNELEDGLFLVDDSQIPRRRNDFISAREVPDGPSMAPSSTRQPGLKKMKAVNKPFVPPMRINDEIEPQDGVRQTKLNIGARRSRTLSNPQELPEDSDLAWAMDFEQRKEDATRQRREEIRAARLEAKSRQSQEDTGFSPHKNRYNAAIATLEAEQGKSPITVPIREPFKTSLPDGDPRAYFMKHQRSMSLRAGGALKLTRAKSMRLPLEMIPENEKLHRLLLPLSADTASLRRISLDLEKSDLYVQRGVLGAGLKFNGPQKEEINSKIQAAVEMWGARKGLIFDEHVSGDGVQIKSSS